LETEPSFARGVFEGIQWWILLFGPVCLVAVVRRLPRFSEPKEGRRFDKDYWRDVIAAFIAGITLLTLQLRFLDDSKRSDELRQTDKKFADMAAAAEPLDFVYECDGRASRITIAANRTDSTGIAIGEYWLELVPVVVDVDGFERSILIKGKPAGTPKVQQVKELRPNSKTDPIETLPFLENEYGGGFAAFLKACEGCRIDSFRATMTYFLWDKQKKLHRRIVTCKS
jgi:hypothetical protein